MKNLLLSLLFYVVVTSSALAQGIAPGAAPGIPTSYLGQVATRSYIPNSFNAGLLQFQTRTAHYARSNISSLQIVIPNFYVGSTGTSPEAGPGGSASVTASVEYPSGTIHRITFSASNTGTVPNNSTLLSDVVSVTIPYGAEFYVRIHYSNASGIVYFGTSGASTINGVDGFVYSASTTPDLTGGGTVTSQGCNCLEFFPAAIITQTTRASICGIGDSRMTGYEDTADSYADIGEIMRSVGPSLGYINMGVPGDSVHEFLVSSTNRMALSAYCSHVVTQYGVNDIIALSRTAAQLVTDINSFIALFPVTTPVWVSTIAPETTSSDSWATPTRTAASPNNQTAVTGSSVIITYNTDVRNGGSVVGSQGFIDIANVVESAWNSTFWIGPGCTGDGIHETVICGLSIQSSGVVPVGRFGR